MFAVKDEVKFKSRSAPQHTMIVTAVDNGTPAPGDEIAIVEWLDENGHHHSVTVAQSALRPAKGEDE